MPDRGPRRFVRLATVSLAVLLSVCLAGCENEELTRVARDIIPPEATVEYFEDDACIMPSSGDTCAEMLLTTPPGTSLDERVAFYVEHAISEGWELVSEEYLLGGERADLLFERPGFEAKFVVYSEKWHSDPICTSVGPEAGGCRDTGIVRVD